MYKFEFKFANDRTHTFENIVKVCYFDPIDEEYVNIENKEILTYKFPLNVDFRLFSETSSVIVSKKDLEKVQVVEITKS